MKTKRDNQGRRRPAPYQAFRDLVMLYGVDRLAGEMLMSPGTLYNKCEASEISRHQPTLRDVVHATRITNDYRLLDAVEDLFDRVAIDVRDMAQYSDEALLELLTKLGKEHGEFHGALHVALTQRRFSRGDFELIHSEALDVVAALMTLVRRLEGLIDE